jgi:hypothetical protein
MLLDSLLLVMSTEPPALDRVSVVVWSVSIHTSLASTGIAMLTMRSR